MNRFDPDAIVKNPAVFADNRLPAHADFIPYRSAAEAKAGDTSLRFPLDGLWRFHFARNPSAAPEAFWAPGYDVSGWDEIRVPAHIQMEGYDAPAYVNGISEALFKVGLCLPAGPYVTDDDVRYIVETIKSAIV